MSLNLSFRKDCRLPKIFQYVLNSTGFDLGMGGRGVKGKNVFALPSLFSHFEKHVFVCFFN